MAEKGGCLTTVVLDATKPKGVLGGGLNQFVLSETIEILNEIKDHVAFELEIFSPCKEEVVSFSTIHLGKPYLQTHCFRGYPIHGSAWQFHQSQSDYILHLDCDMLFYEKDGFSWIKKGVELMEQNEDILSVLPLGGPPTIDGSLCQGSTNYSVDREREIYLFKNFTSRHYLIHRKRFFELLPMRPLWLSWREPIKSRLFGKGKMLCWESIVESSLEKSNRWRADLKTDLAWSLHPGDRSEKFYNLLPEIIKSVNRNEFPDEQRGHFDLCLDRWESFLNK